MQLQGLIGELCKCRIAYSDEADDFDVISHSCEELCPHRVVSSRVCDCDSFSLSEDRICKDRSVVSDQ